MRFIPLIILKYIKLEKITRLDQKEIISYVKICSKVFTDFIKNNYMNNKIIIIIAIVIAIVFGIIIAMNVLNLTQNEIDDEKNSKFGDVDGIESLLKNIEEDKIANEKSKNPYVSKERTWVSSGPFKLDRVEYVLGEKLFVNIDYLDKYTKGEMMLTKIINDTHSYNYKKIQFDGSKPQNNFYIGLNLNYQRGLCDAEKLIGDWELRFEGTNYESIKFKVLDQILPGSERLYEPVC